MTIPVPRKNPRLELRSGIEKFSMNCRLGWQAAGWIDDISE